MGTLWQDIRYGFRMLVRNPGFTAVAVLTLALGIGANTAIFSVVNAVLLQPLPFQDPDRIVQISTHLQKSGTTLPYSNLSDFAEIQSRNHVFEDVAAIQYQALVDIGGDEPRSVLVERVAREFFTLLGVQPMLGRGFRPEEGQPGKDRVLVLSHPYWKERYGAEPNIIGQTATFKDKVYTIIGVMPPDFRFLDYPDVWKPLSMTAEEISSKNSFGSQMIARLKSNVSFEQAQAELNLISSQLMQEYPGNAVERGFHLTPLHKRLVANVRPALWVLFGAVGFVLLIACANVANMLLARSIGRQREVAVRMALGAGRLRLIRQFLTESLLLSIMGGLCALFLTACSLDLITAFLPSTVPCLPEIQIDGWVLCFALSVSVLTAVMIGLAPFLRLSKTTVHQALREGSFNIISGPRQNSLHNVLLVSEAAMSLILLIGAGLMINSFWRLTTIDLGFDRENVLSVPVTCVESIHEQPEPYFEALKNRISQLPGVQTVGFGTLPLFGSRALVEFNMPGRDISVSGEEPTAELIKSSEDYFTALGIPLLMGRFFTEKDYGDAQSVAIINLTIARRYFPDISPVGQTITIQSKSCQIIGIVGDVRPNGFRSDITPTIYVPYLHSNWKTTDTHLVVRIHGPPEALFESIRRELLALSPLRPVVGMRTIQQILAKQVTLMRFNTQLLSLFAAVALALASVGIYGLMAFFVSQRTHEIGIRMALGARSTDVLRSVVGQGLRLALVGLAIGLGAAFVLTRAISSLLYDVSPTDPLTFACTSLLLAGVALLASYIPARRAARIDPMVALRYE